MGISYEPSLLQQLGGGQELGALGEGLAHLINPNFKFQQIMRETIATHPNLGQALADQEAANPGMLKAMGMGPLGDIIGKIPESPDAQTLRENRASILGTKKQQVSNEAGKANLEGIDIEGMIKEITSNPEEAADIARKHLGIGTKAEQRTEAARADITEQTASIANILKKYAPELAQSEIDKALATSAEAKTSIDKADLTRKELEDAIKKYPELRGVDIGAIAEKMASGKPVPGLETMMQLDGFKQAIPLALRAKELDLQRSNARILKEMTNRDRQDRTDESAADQMFRQSNVGSGPAWLAVIQHPGLYEETKKKNPEDLSPMDFDILRIGQYQEQKGQIRDAYQVKAINDQLIKSRHDVDTLINKGAEDADVLSALGNYNQSLQAKARMTGIDIEAVYSNIPEVGQKEGTTHRSPLHPFGGNKGIYFIDPVTRLRLDDNKVNNFIRSEDVKIGDVGQPAKGDQLAKPISINTNSLSNQAKAFYDGYSKDVSANNRAATAKTLKDKLPDVYRELQSRGLFKDNP